MAGSSGVGRLTSQPRGSAATSTPTRPGHTSTAASSSGIGRSSTANTGTSGSGSTGVTTPTASQQIATLREALEALQSKVGSIEDSLESMISVVVDESLDRLRTELSESLSSGVTNAVSESLTESLSKTLSSSLTHALTASLTAKFTEMITTTVQNHVNEATESQRAAQLARENARRLEIDDTISTMQTATSQVRRRLTTIEDELQEIRTQIQHQGRQRVESLEQQNEILESINRLRTQLQQQHQVQQQLEASISSQALVEERMQRQFTALQQRFQLQLQQQQQITDVFIANMKSLWEQHLVACNASHADHVPTPTGRGEIVGAGPHPASGTNDRPRPRDELHSGTPERSHVADDSAHATSTEEHTALFTGAKSSGAVSEPSSSAASTHPTQSHTPPERELTHEKPLDSSSSLVPQIEGDNPSESEKHEPVLAAHQTESDSVRTKIQAAGEDERVRRSESRSPEKAHATQASAATTPSKLQSAQAQATKSASMGEDVSLTEAASGVPEAPLRSSVTSLSSAACSTPADERPIKSLSREELEARIAVEASVAATTMPGDERPIKGLSREELEALIAAEGSAPAPESAAPPIFRARSLSATTMTRRLRSQTVTEPKAPQDQVDSEHPPESARLTREKSERSDRPFGTTSLPSAQYASDLATSSASGHLSTRQPASARTPTQPKTPKRLPSGSSFASSDHPPVRSAAALLDSSELASNKTAALIQAAKTAVKGGLLDDDSGSTTLSRQPSVGHSRHQRVPTAGHLPQPTQLPTQSSADIRPSAGSGSGSGSGTARQSQAAAPRLNAAPAIPPLVIPAQPSQPPDDDDEAVRAQIERIRQAMETMSDDDDDETFLQETPRKPTTQILSRDPLSEGLLRQSTEQSAVATRRESISSISLFAPDAETDNSIATPGDDDLLAGAGLLVDVATVKQIDDSSPEDGSSEVNQPDPQPHQDSAPRTRPGHRPRPSLMSYNPNDLVADAEDDDTNSFDSDAISAAVASTVRNLHNSRYEDRSRVVQQQFENETGLPFPSSLVRASTQHHRASSMVARLPEDSTLPRVPVQPSTPSSGRSAMSHSNAAPISAEMLDRLTRKTATGLNNRSLPHHK